ncbi:hypothetical protein ACFVT5_04025 [Streptomyces sp. NPDC058001]|uniref:hypothetical protein n=1 Tax=Streptomyces sp. NPDC058001 TaxID=3346300 RepID=UPI0036F091C2
MTGPQLMYVTEDGRVEFFPEAAIAYAALIEHTVTCAQCNADQSKCVPGTALRRALRAARR